MNPVEPPAMRCVAIPVLVTFVSAVVSAGIVAASVAAPGAHDVLFIRICVSAREPFASIVFIILEALKLCSFSQFGSCFEPPSAGRAFYPGKL